MKKVLIIILLLVIAVAFLKFFPNKKITDQLIGEWKITIFEIDQEDELWGDEGSLTFDSDRAFKITIDEEYSRGKFRVNFLKMAIITFYPNGDLFDDERFKGSIHFVDGKLKIEGNAREIGGDEIEYIYIEAVPIMQSM